MQSLTGKEQVTIKALLESGAHFGHQTHRWNPKMKRFIFEERNGLYIIDLAKTMQQVRDAVEVVKETIAAKKSILFVGTKKQAKSIIRESAENCQEFYMCERWLGGTLTNLKTIRESVKRLERIEKKLVAEASTMTKKEHSLLSKSQQKLDNHLSGIRSMRKVPGLVIVVDPNKESIAVAEANRLGIPVMALVDTNCDPDLIDYIIACNDDALKCVKLIVQALSNAVIEKKTELGYFNEKKVENPVIEANKEVDQSGDEG
ncbi:MAG: 30S ribosomal protein S2 [Chlamydiae bacterium]|nr:30S ribosomal protein S2 [Chlamydiota bacterium]